MGLDKQIFTYSVDTSAFYNAQEMEIHNKLVKLYLLRNKIKEKPTSTRYAKHLLKCNQLIARFKEKLYTEFQHTKERQSIRYLRKETLIPRNVISVFESTLTRTLGIPTNTLTEDILTVQVYFFEVAEDIIKNGFMYEDEKYVLLTASAGQIRTKRFVVIKESALRQCYDSLTCGLSVDEINAKGGINVNKYLAYYALTNSATDVWEDFDIDKSIVVNDFETLVDGEVDFIDDVSYSIERKTMQVPVPHFDGAGIMLDSPTRMVRLPWVKGLLIQCPFDDFIREKCPDGKAIVKDIYGKEHDILGEGIRYIFTASQFKMYKYYDSWYDYKEKYKRYHCSASYCNPEEDYIPDAQINYQMLQTLSDMTYEEMSRLAKKSVQDINNVGADFATTCRLLGVGLPTPSKNYMQQALEIYPELMRDAYNRQILKDVKKSLIKQAKSGKLAVNGKYVFLAPDVYAFCEWLFLGIEVPQGLLKNGEISCSLYKDGRELDCLRSPHLYREHGVRKNVVNEETKKWFSTKCVYTSTFDLLSKILQFDCDGDKALLVSDRLLIKIAKRNMQNVVPLYYNMKKAQPTELTSYSMYQGLIKAYTSGHIGLYSNNITKIWNCGQMDDEKLSIIKWLCMENNFNIDSAKTLYMPERPQGYNKLIKQYTKHLVPHFFIYAKDKKLHQVEDTNSSPMNMLETIIPNGRIVFNGHLSKLDVNMLLYDQHFNFTEDCDKIIQLYDYYNKHKHIFY